MVIKENPVRRATRTGDKARRRDAILSAAAEAFDRFGFADVSMAWLADRVGLAKGTLYLYFTTKEALFLALYEHELDAWLAKLAGALERLPPGHPRRVAGAIADTLDDQPRLGALAAIRHVVLERNLGEEEAAAFQQRQLARLAPPGALLEQRLEFLLPGDGLRLLLRAHALLVGCRHLAGGVRLRRARERAEFAALRVDASEELENLLALLLEGWRQAGG